jgi:hypothetical protein
MVVPSWSFGAGARSPSRRRLRRSRRAAAGVFARICRSGMFWCSGRGRCCEDGGLRLELLSPVPLFVAARRAPFLRRRVWGWCGVPHLYRSFCCRWSVPASSRLVVVGRWRSRLVGALAVPVHRFRFRHCVADGSCGLLHASRCSLLWVRWWFDLLFSGDVGAGAGCGACVCSCACTWVPVIRIC